MLDSADADTKVLSDWAQSMEAFDMIFKSSKPDSGKPDDAAPTTASTEVPPSSTPGSGGPVANFEEVGAESTDEAPPSDSEDEDLELPPLPPPRTPPPRVQEQEQAPPPPDTPAASGRTAWWLTRTGKRATCLGCNTAIDSYEFRLVYEPGPDEVPNPRKWRTAFWKYFHVRSSCLRHGRLLLPSDPLGVEVSRLPKARQETLDQYNETIDNMIHTARSAFANISMLPTGSAASSSSAPHTICMPPTGGAASSSSAI